MNFNKIISSFRRGEKWRTTRIHTIDEQIERLESERSKLLGSSWIEKIVKPIAKQLAEHYDREYEILGPFGLCSETAIHLYVRDVDASERFFADNCLSITFLPPSFSRDIRTHKVTDVGPLIVRDYTQRQGDYSPNSIAAMNGMNYTSVEVPDDADLDWFIAMVEKEKTPELV